jgi:type IV pilus assembly protein PilX
MINKPLVIAKRQSGVVLVISLILLLALTMIGVTSTSVTGQQEKMSGNNKDKNLAFQAAEAALRAAEITLSPVPPTFNRTAGTATTVAVSSDQGTNGLYTLLNSDETASSPPTIKLSPRIPFYNSVDWLATNPKYCVFGTHTNCADPVNKLVGLYRPPEYIIEEISSVGALNNAMGSSEAGVALTNTAGRVVTYRITGHGWGSNANSVATIQSIIKVTVYK